MRKRPIHWNSGSNKSANTSSHSIGTPPTPSRISVVAPMKRRSRALRAIIPEVISPHISAMRDGPAAEAIAIHVGDVADTVAMKPDIPQLTVVKLTQGNAGRLPFATSDHGGDGGVDKTPDAAAQPAPQAQRARNAERHGAPRTDQKKVGGQRGRDEDSDNGRKIDSAHASSNRFKMRRGISDAALMRD